MENNVAAILLAAGKGRRFGGQKQFYKIKGYPLIFFSLHTLCCSPFIQRIILVTNQEGMKECEKIVKEKNLDKVKDIVIGGKRRQDSVREGLKRLKEEELVLIHDGARPLIDESLIKNVLDAAKEIGAASCGVPIMDTIKYVKDGMILSTVEREGLWLAHTPQAFLKDIIVSVHERAVKEGFFATDDAGLLEHYKFPIKMVKGSPMNIKITFAEDVEFLELLLEHAGWNRF